MNKLTIIGELTSNPKGRVLCTKGPACAVCDFTVAARNAPQETCPAVGRRRSAA